MYALYKLCVLKWNTIGTIHAIYYIYGYVILMYHLTIYILVK